MGNILRDGKFGAIKGAAYAGENIFFGWRHTENIAIDIVAEITA